MLERNIKFMDLYKSVDRFIRDAYGAEKGVSEYLEQMEQNDYKGSRFVPAWKEDYEKLKHLRWIRNQLSHEVGYDSDICEVSDFSCLQEFNNRLYSASDPMALLNKAAQREQQKLASTTTPAQLYKVPARPRYRKSFWQKVRDYFLGR